MIRKIFATLFVVSLLLGASGSAWAQDEVPISWNPVTTNADNSPCTDLAGYKVSMSTTSGGPYTDIGDVPTGTATFTWTAPDAPGTETTYYFVVQAYDLTYQSDPLKHSNNISGYSTEAIARIDQLAPAVPQMQTLVSLNLNMLLSLAKPGEAPVSLKVRPTEEGNVQTIQASPPVFVSSKVEYVE
jgi:hypothetical protein